MPGWRIPENQRSRFKEPIGKKIQENELSELNASRTITVGDMVSLKVRENGITPILSVYDGRTERREMTAFADLVARHGLKETVVSNPAGTITAELADAVKNAMTGKTDLIRVEGEEDLALLPCVLYSPDGTEIIYGWPGEGMMRVRNDGGIRKRVEELWKTMEDFE